MRYIYFPKRLQVSRLNFSLTLHKKIQSCFTLQYLKWNIQLNTKQCKITVFIQIFNNLYHFLSRLAMSTSSHRKLSSQFSSSYCSLTLIKRTIAKEKSKVNVVASFSSMNFQYLTTSWIVESTYSAC